MTKRSGHKGPGRDSTSAKAIVAAERHAEWLEKRKQGWTYRRIAAHYNVAHSTVEEAVTKVLEAVRIEPGKALFALQLEALDDLIGQALDSVEAPEVRIELIRKLRADQRKMLGLDAPLQVHTKLEHEAVDVDELRALLRPLGWDIVPLAVETTGEQL